MCPTKGFIGTLYFQTVGGNPVRQPNVTCGPSLDSNLKKTTANFFFFFKTGNQINSKTDWILDIVKNHGSFGLGVIMVSWCGAGVCVCFRVLMY